MFFERSIESYDAYLDPRVVEYKQTSQCFVSFCISVTSHHESGVYKFAKSFAS